MGLFCKNIKHTFLDSSIYVSHIMNCLIKKNLIFLCYVFILFIFRERIKTADEIAIKRRGEATQSFPRPKYASPSISYFTLNLIGFMLWMWEEGLWGKLMWNPLILVEQDNLYNKSSPEQKEKSSESSVRMCKDEQRGCHTHLVLIISTDHVSLQWP